jgi:hypothetical protein
MAAGCFNNPNFLPAVCEESEIIVGAASISLAGVLRYLAV